MGQSDGIGFDSIFVMDGDTHSILHSLYHKSKPFTGTIYFYQGPMPAGHDCSKRSGRNIPSKFAIRRNCHGVIGLGSCCRPNWNNVMGTIFGTSPFSLLSIECLNPNFP